MATLTVADLDNGKRDLETVSGVANSRDVSVPTRFGQQTLTLYEAIRRIVAAGDAQLADQKEAAEEILRSLGYLVPVPYESGLEVTTAQFTVVGPDGVVYSARAADVPFVTGDWDPSQWTPIQNTMSGNQLLVFDTLSAAESAAAILPDDQTVDVADEKKRYKVEAGELVFAENLDQLRIDLNGSDGSDQVGTIQPAAGAVRRTVKKKGEDVYSLFDFMLPAQIADVKARTMSVDVTIPLQKAFDSGERLIGPRGRYRHSGLVAPEGLILFGDGEGKTTLDCVESGVNLLVQPPGNARIYQLSGFTLNGGTNGIEYANSGADRYIDRASFLRNINVSNTTVCGIKNRLGMIGTNNYAINFENPGDYGFNSEGVDVLGSSTWGAMRSSRAKQAGVHLKETGPSIHPNITFTGLICEGGDRLGFYSYSTQSVLINPHFENNGKLGNGTTELYADIHGDGDGILINKIHLIGGAFSNSNPNQSRKRVFLAQHHQQLTFDDTYFPAADIVDCNNKGSASMVTMRTASPPLIINQIQSSVTEGKDGVSSPGVGPAINSNPGGGTGAWGAISRVTSKYVLNASAFTATGTTQDFATFLIPAKMRVVSVIAEVTAPFSGSGWTAATISFGKTIGGAQYLVTFDCMVSGVKGLLDADLGPSLARATANQGGDIPSWTAQVNTNLRISVTGGVVVGITSGSVTVYITTEKMP